MVAASGGLNQGLYKLFVTGHTSHSKFVATAGPLIC